jgi:transglutaminase-like putative cysteine protease
VGVSSPRLTVRVGCRVTYETTVPTPVLVILRPRLVEHQRMLHERLLYDPDLPVEEFQDVHGNITSRLVFQPGGNTIHHDALVELPSWPDNHDRGSEPTPVEEIPPLALRYTLPSRYCDSDKLLDFAWEQFGQVENGAVRVQAICDWIHKNIEYRFGSGRPDTSAAEVIAQRYGVCRDFAHVGVALCRCFNLPARYVSGHLPDIGFLDPGSAMDFHAYFEVYFDHKWNTFDARFNVPRIGRIKVADGLDAVDGAFTTIFGQATLTWFQVWAYQVNPAEVSVGDPIDISKRLDGTPLLRFS